MIGHRPSATRGPLRRWLRMGTFASLVAGTALSITPAASDIAHAAPVNLFPDRLILDETANIDHFEISSTACGSST